MSILCMKNVGKAILAMACFVIATVLLGFNVKQIAHAPLLLGAIVLFYLLAFAVAFPTDLAQARVELTSWWTAYKAGGGAS